MKIITGNTGMKHVTSDDDGAIYASIIGKDDYVLDMNDNFSYEVIDTNTIKINSGDALLNGRHIRTPRGSYDLVSIDNGQTGYNRIDLIVIRYESNGEIEQAYLHVIKGEQTTGVASVPTYETESILNGALIHDMPLYEVHLNGINLEEVKKVFGAKNLSTTNLGYRPNLLINSDFRNPINQRGQTSYWKPSSWTYNVDRWTHIYNSVILEDGYIRIYNDSGETGTTFFKQIFERPLEQNDYTVTVNVKEINGIVQVEGFGTLVKGLNVFTIKNTSLHQLQLNLVGESSVELYCIKLEQGSIATPFVPRPYGEELALCQRYYQIIKDVSNNCYPDGISSIGEFMGHQFPTQMRITPTYKIKWLTTMYYETIDISVIDRIEGIDQTGFSKIGSKNDTTFDKRSIRYEIEFDAEIY